MTSTKLQQEHFGLAKVHVICAEMNAVWRATPNTDLGIDGQIELLEPGKVISTGKIVAVQVKSGPSYFIHEDENFVRYYPKETHRKYWKRLNLPVILILHDPLRNLTLYARVKSQLESGAAILVSKTNLFNATSRADLLHEYELDQSSWSNSFDAESILMDFREARDEIAEDVTINGVHFLLSCCNPEQGFFELRHTRIFAVLEVLSRLGSIGIDGDYYDFIHRCVVKCWAHRLTEPFAQEFERVWYDLQMVPDLLVPLTSHGRKLMEHLLANTEAYLPVRYAQEAGVKTSLQYAEMLMNVAQIASDRLDHSDRLGEKPR
ncbi:MAG: DUF4365 domain-containing protein [Halobacteriota archaeon]